MRALTLSLILLALAACERDGHFERPLNPGQARVLDTHLAWVLPEQREVVLVDPSAPHARRVALAGEARATQVAPDGRGWLVLDFDGATWIPLNGAVRRIPLGGSYQRVAFAPDGARAVLYAEQGAGATLSNPNQIAVLDLEAGTATERTLRSYGSAPQQVVVAPDTAGRPLAWLLAERYLALIDLSLPAAREVVVHLVLAADPREVTPAQVAFGEVDGVPVTFVRALGSDDLFSLTFPEAPSRGGGASALPQPAAGGRGGCRSLGGHGGRGAAALLLRAGHPGHHPPGHRPAGGGRGGLPCHPHPALPGAAARRSRNRRTICPDLVD
jgi:hypothetical protein